MNPIEKIYIIYKLYYLKQKFYNNNDNNFY